MIVVIDNAVDVFNKPVNERLEFYEIGENHECKPMCEKLLTRAKQFYDLSSMVGYDFWGHTNNKLDWHYDRDENIKDHVSCPLFSIVFYSLIRDLRGGELVFEDGTTVIPKSNRAVFFDPFIKHKVNPSTGTRVSYNVNPFNYIVGKSIQ
jgi:hypothetical protein